MRRLEDKPKTAREHFRFTRSNHADHGRRSKPTASSILVGAQDLCGSSSSQRAIGGNVDGILDELDGPVSHGEIRPAGVEAAEPVLAQVEAGCVVDPIRWKERAGKTGTSDRSGLVGRRVQPGDDESAGGWVTNVIGVIVDEFDGNVANRES
jgi:hypothetical protein